MTVLPFLLLLVGASATSQELTALKGTHSFDKLTEYCHKYPRGSEGNVAVDAVRSVLRGFGYSSSVAFEVRDALRESEEGAKYLGETFFTPSKNGKIERAAKRAGLLARFDEFWRSNRSDLAKLKQLYTDATSDPSIAGDLKARDVRIAKLMEKIKGVVGERWDSDIPEQALRTAIAPSRPSSPSPVPKETVGVQFLRAGPLGAGKITSESFKDQIKEVPGSSTETYRAIKAMLDSIRANGLNLTELKNLYNAFAKLEFSEMPPVQAQLTGANPHLVPVLGKVREIIASLSRSFRQVPEWRAYQTTQILAKLREANIIIS